MTKRSSPLRRAVRAFEDSSRTAGGTARAVRAGRRRLAQERGIGMIELVVTMGLMAIVVGALSSVIVAASKAEVRTNRTFQAQVQGRIALNKLRRELHCASAVTVKSSTGTAVSNGTAGAQIG